MMKPMRKLQFCATLLLMLILSRQELPAADKIVVGAVLTIDSSSMQEGTNSNNDGILDPGEDGVVTFVVRNVGPQDSNPVTVTVTPSIPQVVMNPSSVNIGALPSNATSEPHELAFTAAGNAPCGTGFTFSINPTSDNGISIPGTLSASIGGFAPGEPQTFTSTETPLAIPSDDTTGATVNVTVPAGIASINRVSVNLSIDHTFDSDLTIYLTSPAGTTRILSERNGGSGANYTNTTFTDLATTSITAGSPPYTGEFQPENPLSDYSNQASEGVWQLKVTDTVSGDVGTITAFSVIISPNEPVCHAGASANAPGLRPVLHIKVGTESVDPYGASSPVTYSYRWTSSGPDDIVVHANGTLEDSLNEDSGVTFDIGETWTVQVTPKSNGTEGAPSTAQFIITENGVVFAGWVMN
ncbi:hypothetical protein BH09SUM1_BH09SUM1_04800 [soil metagenome]